MKIGQLIEYNMRHIFLEKSYTECGERVQNAESQDPFLQNQN